MSDRPTPDALERIAHRAGGDVAWLADDARDGRRAGSAGGQAAAEYIEQRFKSLGLRPLPSLGGYGQSFDVPGEVRQAEGNTLRAGDLTLQLGVDFNPLGWSASRSFEGKLAFAGYGIDSERNDYNDFAEVDLTGCVVLILRYEPLDDVGRSRFADEGFSGEAALWKKIRQAQNAGAAAVLLTNPPALPASEQPPALLQTATSVGPMADIPVMHLTNEAADRLLAAAGDDRLAALQSAIDVSVQPHSFVTDLTVSGTAAVEKTTAHAKNIVALLPGSGSLANEYVVVGAHYDHLGHGNFGSRSGGSDAIHNGADDNASGTAAMMSIAEQLARGGRGGRSVIFVAFDGEELGLLGSQHFVGQPPVPLKQIAAMVNLDMVGRLRHEKLYIGGDGTAAEFEAMLNEADERSPISLSHMGGGGGGPSDHASFSAKQIPVLFFFTGLHAQYHTPEDDTPLVNADGIAQVVQLATPLVRKLTTMPRPAYDARHDSDALAITNPDLPTTQPSTQPASTHGRALLGVVPDYGSDESAKGVRITGTTPGTPAEKAGLQDGDVLVQLGKTKIENLYDLTNALNDARPEEEAVLVYERDGKRVEATIIFGARQRQQ